LLVVFVALAGTVLIFSRRPDAFLHPQFWAEDGPIYFAPAFNSGGLAHLLTAYHGYPALLNRSVALLAIHLPLAWAPSVFNAIGLLCQLLPALIVVSRRAETLISSRIIRIGVAAFYFALPGTFETDINLTNAQWHLALAAALLLVATPPRTVAGHLFD